MDQTFIHEMINMTLCVLWYNKLSFVCLGLAAVHCNNRGGKDGAHTEVGRQRDQPGQGSRWQRPHTGEYSIKICIFNIRMCVCVFNCVSLSPSQTLTLGEVVCKRHYEKA